MVKDTNPSELTDMQYLNCILKESSNFQSHHFHRICIMFLLYLQYYFQPTQFNWKMCQSIRNNHV